MDSKTPDRIWLDYEHSNIHWMAFEEPPNDKDDSAKDEYVRADLADAWAKERDRLRAELAEAQRERDYWQTAATLASVKFGDAKAEAERLREALARVASPEAFFVATSGVDPETLGRMVYAQAVLDGASLEDATAKAEAECRKRAEEEYARIRTRAALQEKPHD